MNPYDEGAEAWRQGKLESACEYPQDSGRRIDWERGWRTELISKQKDDPCVDVIVFNLDSPGGEVVDLEDLSSKVR